MARRNISGRGRRRPRRRAGPARGPLADELARWLPVVTVAGGLLLSAREIIAFAEGGPSALATLSHLVLGSAVAFVAARLVLGVVAHYERRNGAGPGEGGDG
ncbi:MAG: hypothetical protein M0T80_12975 [Actinomycetota bacterium]|nr:hypothetical protein [Actinomycetota bacterium]